MEDERARVMVEELARRMTIVEESQARATSRHLELRGSVNAVKDDVAELKEDTSEIRRGIADVPAIRDGQRSLRNALIGCALAVVAGSVVFAISSFVVFGGHA